MSRMAKTRPSIRQQQTEQTRNAILEAAKYLFARRGYTESGVRDIAARANVNPALIARYYGSKLGLLEAVLETWLDVTLFTETDRAAFGETIADAFCNTVDDAANVIPALMFATSDSDARELVLRLLKKVVMKPLEQWFGRADAADRASQLMIVVTGFYTYRLMLPLEPLQGTPTLAMRRWLTRTLQELVDR